MSDIIETPTSRGDYPEFVRKARAAYSGVRHALRDRMAYDMCMYEGIQWLVSTMPEDGYSYRSRLGVLPVEYRPDQRTLRVTHNVLTKHVQKVAAATFPERVYADVRPKDGSGEYTGPAVAQTGESAINLLVDESGYIRHARRANFRRTVIGAYGLGFTVAPDTGRLEAFSFYPDQLVLDPSVDEDDLSAHPYVILEQVWTAKKIKRLLGVTLKDEELAPVGQLEPYRARLSEATQGRVFSDYKTHSKTPGARVITSYTRGKSGLFDTVTVMVETQNGDHGEPGRVVMAKQPGECLFGGDGLPLAILTGHDRADSMWGISESAMARDFQHRINLYETITFRILRRYAAWQWLYDVRSVPNGVSPGDFQKKFSNLVGGGIPYNGGRRDQDITPPQLVRQPDVPPFLMDGTARLEQSMRENMHRAESHYGMTKSHVPDRSFQRAMDEADQVHSTRIRRDLEVHERLLGVMDGTVSKILAMGGKPAETMRETLLGGGLDEDQVATLRALDPRRRPYTIRVNESTVRHRPNEARRRDLIDAVNAGAIDGDRFARILARDLDVPLDESDRIAVINARKAADRIVAGGEWTALPLGRFGEVYIEQFEMTLMDPRVQDDAGARGRLAAAIVAQRQEQAREQIQRDPAVLLQMEQARAGADGAQEELANLEAEAMAAAEPPDVSEAPTFADVVSGMTPRPSLSQGATPERRGSIEPTPEPEDDPALLTG